MPLNNTITLAPPTGESSPTKLTVRFRALIPSFSLPVELANVAAVVTGRHSIFPKKGLRRFSFWRLSVATHPTGLSR